MSAEDLSLMSPSIVPNGGAAGGNSTTGRYTVMYSHVQTSRLNQSLPLPSVLKSEFKLVDGPASSAAGNPGFHHLFAEFLDAEIFLFFF